MTLVGALHGVFLTGPTAFRALISELRAAEEISLLNGVFQRGFFREFLRWVFSGGVQGGFELRI